MHTRICIKDGRWVFQISVIIINSGDLKLLCKDQNHFKKTFSHPTWNFTLWAGGGHLKINIFSITKSQ